MSEVFILCVSAWGFFTLTLLVFVTKQERKIVSLENDLNIEKESKTYYRSAHEEMVSILQNLKQEIEEARKLNQKLRDDLALEKSKHENTWGRLTDYMTRHRDLNKNAEGARAILERALGIEPKTDAELAS